MRAELFVCCRASSKIKSRSQRNYRERLFLYQPVWTFALSCVARSFLTRRRCLFFFIRFLAQVRLRIDVAGESGELFVRCFFLFERSLRRETCFDSPSSSAKAITVP